MAVKGASRVNGSSPPSGDSGASSPTVVEDEDDYQDLVKAKSEEYAIRIAKLQEEYLIPLKEDLADWLNRVLGIDEISAENFMDKLDNGVIVCKLAKAVEAKCVLDIDPLHHRGSRASTINGSNGPSPRKVEPSQANAAGDRYLRTSSSSSGADQTRKTAAQRHSFDGAYIRGDDLVKINMSAVKCWETAKSQSFYARDNVCNFIKWCRYLNVREAVIFESEDLVLHNNQRNVVLCLLEVARIACTKYSFSPSPGLVDFEQEIDQEIEKEEAAETGQSGENRGASHPTDPLTGGLRCPSVPDGGGSAAGSSEDAGCWSSEGLSSPRRSPSATSLVSSTSMASSSGPSSTAGDTTTFQSKDNASLLISQLDQKVMLIAKSFFGKKARHGVQRLAEGKYRIAGRIVFVRLLRDRHVMVRVGGGWDTLEHFLERHGGDAPPDISPSDLLPMDTRPSESKRRSSGLINNSNNSANNSFISNSNVAAVASVPATPEKQSQPTQQLAHAIASTPPAPIMRRCLSSTPVSRRSSISSPEPWSASSICSSGYTSGGGGGGGCGGRPPSREALSRRSSICATPNAINAAESRTQQVKRRSLISEVTKARVINRSSLGLNLIPVTPKGSSATAPCSPSRIPVSSAVGSLPPSPLSAASGIKPPNRYPNYLSSSQHITTTRNPNSGQYSGAKATAARRASLRAF